MSATCPIQDFTQVKTIYRTNIRTIQLKICHAYLASPALELQTAGTPYDVYQVLQAIYSTLDDGQEHLVILILNAARDITGYKLIASGGQEHTFVDSKILFRNALLLGANGIILAHNHPSGHLQPSEQDIELTKKVVAGGQVLDIDVVDHIIYTPHGYTSLRKVAPTIFSEVEG